MIRHLRVRDFVLIDELELALGEGFYALTGETGAGKSVLARAVELLRGGRASSEVVRTGADEATIEAILEPGPGSSAWPRLREAGLPEGDGQLVVRRVVARSGRGRVYLNGALATTTQLGEVAGPLIDVASQHEHQSLGQTANHLEALDAFGRFGAQREAMATAYEALRAGIEAAQAVDLDEATRAERADFLRFQLAQIEELAPRVGEETDLLRERERLRAAERLALAARRAEEALYAGEGAAADALARAARELAQVVAIDPELAPIAAQLEDARAQISDAAAHLRRYAERTSGDEVRLAAIEDRLDALGRVLRKHGPSVADVLAKQGEMAGELAGLDRHGERKADAERALAAAREEATRCATALRAAREAAAGALVARVREGLAAMQMAGAYFQVRVAPCPSREGDPTELVVGGARLQAHGADRVEFLIQANPGEPLAPLARVASGGELSRVMLALKLATADADAVATYVFDEVDAGIGGGVAEAVGRVLRDVSRHRQVLCITHLPQIAAFADVHLRVAKEESDARTLQRVERLDAPAREREIARMMAGREVTAKARAHAAEMLKRARA
jgi:DNA repair protein RecN (Recombination protein N)